MKDCWNSIGVTGDGSCLALAEHIHCRNCPVYASAGRTILDGPLPPGYTTGRTRHFAQLKEATSREMLPVLVFRVGEEWLALAMSSVWEVAQPRTIRALPHRSSGIVLGLASIRGELLVCISFEKLLSPRPSHHDPNAQARRRLVVMRYEGSRVAGVADEVDGIHRVLPEEIRPAPATVARAAAPHARGLLTLQGRAIGVLDDRQLFQDIQRGLA